ncbi:MAG: putative rane protein [Gemmatimonadetes bacterium]|jgi:diguanylate cyclase (GGDEF)-like protein|nr:putative rane protein [Gemmatimonadota bacterium]
MSHPPETSRQSVTMPDTFPVVTEGLSADTSRLSDEERDRGSRQALLAQLPARAAAALVVGVVQLAILYALPGRGDVLQLAGVTAVYLVLVVLCAALVRARAQVGSTAVTAVLALDLAFVFIVTAVSTSPAHYERALFGTMIVIHVANFYFGRRQAWRVVVMGFIGYIVLTLAASARGLPVDRVEEIWTLGIGLLGTLLIVAQAGHVRRRLHTIVTLFERAEQGDFSHTYDEEGDQRHDAITRVGRAYNRVRTQLASMVLSDSLTGCLNRRGFEQALAREISRASRAGTELALLVLDLDHFKMVNDTHGHPAGDEVLRAAGRLLLQTARVGDIVARVGGEEFAVLLPTTGVDGGLHFASRLCDLVRAHPFSIAAHAPPIRVTTSIGVAAVAPRNTRESGGDGAVLARHADMALYAAKRTGRDRARQWDPELDIMPRTSGAPDVGDMIPLGLA